MLLSNIELDIKTRCIEDGISQTMFPFTNEGYE